MMQRIGEIEEEILEEEEFIEEDLIEEEFQVHFDFDAIPPDKLEYDDIPW